jgi:hypothetical protein
MKRLLIVSPRFAPVSSADNQRVLQMIPWLHEQGWKVFVAAVDCTDLGLPEDFSQVARMRAACEWRSVKPTSLKLTRWMGVRSLALRARQQLDRMVRAWHREIGFDLVFMSNTEFGLWSLAPLWLRALGLAYVLDWQDPWVSDYYRQRPNVTPPGGRLKFGVMQALARRQEPDVARNAAAHVCVSSYYIRMLRERYPDISESIFSVIPFSFVQQPLPDLSVMASATVERYWAYAGRGGDDMRFALTALFRALAKQRALQPERFAGLRLKFVGTSYADAARSKRSIAPVAQACGVADMVEESPQRITPDQVRSLLQGAEALVIPGSDDAGYVASKIQSCLALAKPMLAIFHVASDAVSMLDKQAGVVTCTFTNTEAESAGQLAECVRTQWMLNDPRSLPVHPRHLQDHSPQAMAARLSEVFFQAIKNSARRST